MLDYKSMRRALRGIDVLFHVAGYVASSPVQRVWELNADGPVVAVEAAAAEGVAARRADLDDLRDRHRQRKRTGG